MGIQPVYRERNSGRAVDAVHHTRVLKSSDDFAWQGMQLEVARGRGWHVDDLMVDGHLLAFNLDDRSLRYRMRSEADWLDVSLPPQGFWIHPEGKPFSIAHDEQSHYASIFVDGRFMDEVCGQHIELRAGNGVVDDTLARIAQALIGVLCDERPYCAEPAEHLIRAFVHTLARRHGQAAAAYMRGGIAPMQLNSLLAWLQRNLHASLTVRDMAARVGLSAAHFSREFKRSTGCTPWGYVTQLRLDGARQLLETGEMVGEVALRYGFADQAHLSRLFKQKYGLTPSSFVRSRGSSHVSASVEPA